MANTKNNVSSLRMPDGNVVQLEYHDILPSTVDLARKYAQSGYPDRYAVYTEHLVSVPQSDLFPRIEEGDRGVYLSCILRPSIFPSQAGFLGVAAGVGLLTALEGHTSKELGIGWVGDIYCEGKKIGGATIEGKLDAFMSYEYIIVSFAVRLDEHSFSPLLGDMIRKVFESENVSIPMIIAKNILTSFLHLYANLKTPSKFMDTYLQKFALRGTHIRYRAADGKYRRCKILGVEKRDASLLAEGRHGELLRLQNRALVRIPRRIKRSRRKKASGTVGGLAVHRLS